MLYVVRLEQTVIEQTTLLVEADDEDQAHEKAMETSPYVEWDFTEISERDSFEIAEYQGTWSDQAAPIKTPENHFVWQIIEERGLPIKEGRDLVNLDRGFLAWAPI